MKPVSLQSEQHPVLRERGLVVVSSRGPISHHLAPDGSINARRSAGGLVTALLSLARYLPFTWVAGAVTAGDRVVASQGSDIATQPFPAAHPVAVRLIRIPKRVFHRFYTVIANSLLWPLHHYLWDVTRLADVSATLYTAWSRGYVPANQAFAKAVMDLAEKAGTQPVVLLQDYHLFLVAAFLRPQLPQALISHFLHIPWPGPRYWMMLPRAMRDAILNGLGNCDVVGLQTEQDVRNFLDSWELSQKGAVVDRQRQVVITPEERIVAVRAYPISVDVAHLEEMAGSPQVRGYREAMQKERRDQSMIVRVDRLDSIKNIVRGFMAYERLLEEHPELQGTVRFCALLVPSRQDLAAYRRYTKQVERVVERINSRFSREGWQPVTTYMENNYERGLALLQEYDVLLVNSLIDGMNLVAKEGCILNRRHGVIVLSETAGSYQELANGVLPVGPADLNSMKDALYRALTMDAEERARKAAYLRQVVRQRDLSHWLGTQLRDLAALA